MVYLLQPASVDFQWDKVDTGGRDLHDKFTKGIPLLQDDMPQTTEVGGDFQLPDLVSPSTDFWFVSENGREALESLAPNCIIFYTINVQAPSSMRPETNYFYPEIIARRQTVDWSKTESLPRPYLTPDGKEIRSTAPHKLLFLPAEVQHPLIWREADYETHDVYYHTPKNRIFLSDELWAALNDKFPDQLHPRVLGG